MSTQARPATNIITRSSSDPYEGFAGDVAQLIRTSLFESFWILNKDILAADLIQAAYPSTDSVGLSRFSGGGSGALTVYPSTGIIPGIESGNYLSFSDQRPIVQYQSIFGSSNAPGYPDFVSPTLPLNVGLHLSNTGKIRGELEAGIAGADSGSESYDAHVDAVVSYTLFKYGYDLVAALTHDFSNAFGIDDVTHTFIRSLSRISDPDSLFIRRNILGAALPAPSPSVRSAAAVALGDIGDRISISHLRGRHPWEKNVAVRNMIKAQML